MVARLSSLAPTERRAGSIADFLPVYLRQIVEAGYFNAPLEKDAREHEIDTP